MTQAPIPIELVNPICFDFVQISNSRAFVPIYHTQRLNHSPLETNHKIIRFFKHQNYSFYIRAEFCADDIVIDYFDAMDDRNPIQWKSSAVITLVDLIPDQKTITNIANQMHCLWLDHPFIKTLERTFKSLQRSISADN